MSIKRTLAELPDRMLLAIPNWEKGKKLSRTEYNKQLMFYTQYLSQNPDAFYKDLTSSIPLDIKIESEKKSNGITERLVSFSSHYTALNPDIQNEINHYSNNLTCYVNLWEQDKTKPLVLCIHGLKMGGIKTSYKMFKIKKLLNKGLNVAVMIQPHHGLRSPYKLKQYFLNPGNVPLTIEAARQAVQDGTNALAFLKQHFNRIGVIGASLGGFTALNIAINTDIPEFVFASQPAVSFENYIKPSKANMAFKINDHVKKNILDAMKIISPIQYKAKLPKEKIAILYHEDDLITPAKNVERLISLWGIQNKVSVKGGHWLYYDKQHTRGKFWYGWLAKNDFINKKI